MNAVDQAIKKGRKFDQVIDGAREVFMRDGFEGASVDEIARAAGVSKATLYSYFPDKRFLFMEVAKTECLRQEAATDKMINDTAEPEVVLRLAAMRMITFFTSSLGLSVFRVCVAESDRFPDLGREFWESGPARIRARIMAYLESACARGQLRIEDLGLAADQFCELCKADVFPRMVFGIQTSFSQAEIARIADGAVATFMARYRA